MTAPASPGGEGTQVSPERLELALARTVQAPAQARAAVAERLARAGLDGAFGQTVVLLVSEVVTNAVRHSGAPADSPIVLSAEVTDEAVRVAVTDAGEGFTPRPRDPDSLADGYGLFLLEKAATRWGVQRADGTTVWFELAREG